MLKYIFLLITALATCGLAQASPVATASFPDGNAWVQLTNEPCTLEVASAIMGPYFPLAKKAEAVVSGHHFDACFVVQNGQVGLVFEDGDVGAIPIEAFTNKKIM